MARPHPDRQALRTPHLTARLPCPRGENSCGKANRRGDEKLRRTSTREHDTSQLSYAGIGSRETPRPILDQMTVMASWLARRGWHLHSGGARGADSAFATGTPDARTIHLPWPGYENHSGPGCHVPADETYRRCIALAAEEHPAWHRCSQGARRLHARNVSILLGRDLESPVRAVVCWTKGGRVVGGTGMGIRIAHRFGIPVLNLGSMHPRAVCEQLESIRTPAA